MALSSGRSGNRFSSVIWPGFVDALTTLLLILIFLVTIFMVVQFSLRQTIDTQDNELDALADQVAGLADALGLERDRTSRLESDLAGANVALDTAAAEADRQSTLIANLTAQLDSTAAALGAAESRITAFEAQVAGLLAARDQALGERDAARAEAADLSAARDRLLTEQETLNLAVPQARAEIDAQAEAARIAPPRREALMALVADHGARGDETAARLTYEEEARAVEADAAAARRERLKSGEDELTSMTLAL